MKIKKHILLELLFLITILVLAIISYGKYLKEKEERHYLICKEKETLKEMSICLYYMDK